VWESYEKYIINRHYEVRNEREKTRCMEHIEYFYTFLISLDLEPFTKTKSNGDLITSLEYSVDTDVTEMYYKIYSNVKKNIKKGEISKIQKDVKNIIINQCKSNNKSLNDAILDLVSKDNTFKDKVLSIH